MKKVEGVLKEHNAFGGTFTDIGQHTPVAGIHEGLKQFKEVGANIIVAVGGGSPIDASKAILYFHQKEVGGETLKQIAIPTTLSAAEYTVRMAVILQSRRHCDIHNSRAEWRGIHKRRGCQGGCVIPRSHSCRHHPGR